MLNIAIYSITQNNFTEIWAVKDCNLYVLLQVRQEENVPQHIFSSRFSLKSACHDCVWYDEDLERIYQKQKILTLVHIFACNSKSISLQRASFTHAGTYIFEFFTPTLYWGSSIFKLNDQISSFVSPLFLLLGEEHFQIELPDFSLSKIHFIIH